ncbi:MAG: extracellular solute-binding protein, partial [Solobacterium sp.]|nr:extracellular solute-binding protein [Solobacterium sp.]
MKSTKLASLGLAALMGISVLAGCGSKKESNTTASDSKEVTLTVWTPSEDQSEEQGNWLKKQLDAFQEAHPEWKLTFNTGVCPEGDAKTLVAADPSAAADVYMFANDQIPDLLKANAIAELGGSAVEAIKKNNSDITVDTVTYENSVYGVPFTANTWFMY